MSKGIAVLAVAAAVGCSPRSAARDEPETEDAAVVVDAATVVVEPDGGADADPLDAAPDATVAVVADGAVGQGWPGPPLVVAVGNDGRHVVSLNGERWTNDVRDVTGNRDMGTRALRAVAYAGDLVVAVGGGCNPTCVGRIVTFDGRAWTEATIPAGQGRLEGVAHGAGVWVAVGAAGAVLRSTDGARTWSPAGPVAPAALRAVTFGRVGGEEMFVAVGDGYVRARSRDGATWTDLVPPTPAAANEALRAVVTGNGLVIAAGGKPGAGRRTRSADGVAWTDEVTGGPDLGSLVFADDRFMAFSGSADATVHVSVDGRTWVTQATSNAGSNVAAGLLPGGRLFVSRVSPATIRTSPDGIVWSTRVTSMQGDATINAFAFAGQ